MTCTFFGHRYISQSIEPLLREVIIDLIENKGVDKFYVGTHGSFDNMVKRCLYSLEKIYPHIQFNIVLAYLPHQAYEDSCEDFSKTIYPEGLESSPPKYAIIKRNEWMIKNSDCVVTHVTHTAGGAARFKEIAEKAGKYVINII